MPEETPAGAAPARSAPTPLQSVHAATYALRVRELEARIDELKEQIRRSHARLSLPSDKGDLEGDSESEDSELMGAWFRCP